MDVPSDPLASEPVPPSRGKGRLWGWLVIGGALLIVAFLAVPSLLHNLGMSSGSGESAIVAMLKTVGTAEQTWRLNDLDGNGIQDYWTLDAAGMACLPDGAGNPRQHISMDLARADAGSGGRYLDRLGQPLPKSGYFLRAVVQDADGEPLAVDTDGDGKATSNTDHFAFCGYPDEYGEDARFTFLLTDDGALWRKDLGPQGRGIYKLPADPQSEGWSRAD